MKYIVTVVVLLFIARFCQVLVFGYPIPSEIFLGAAIGTLIGYVISEIQDFFRRR
jgi:hypothetical protein